MKIVAIKLRKHASIWWERLFKEKKKDEVRLVLEKYEGKSPQEVLPKDIFKKPTLTYNNLLKEHNLWRNTWRNLIISCFIVEPKEQTIACYLRGLKCDIHDKVRLQSYITLNDIVKFSIKVKYQLPQ